MQKKPIPKFNLNTLSSVYRLFNSSSTCHSPHRYLVVSWPRSPSVGTSACSLLCCEFPAMLQSSPNLWVASHQTIRPSPPCVKSLEVGNGWKGWREKHLMLLVCYSESLWSTVEVSLVSIGVERDIDVVLGVPLTPRGLVGIIRWS